MSNAKEGVEINTRKQGRPKQYSYRTIMEWMRENFRDMPEWRRDLILNQFAAACQRYYIMGREGNLDFETLFNNQPKNSEQ